MLGVSGAASLGVRGWGGDGDWRDKEILWQAGGMERGGSRGDVKVTWTVWDRERIWGVESVAGPEISGDTRVSGSYHWLNDDALH